MNAYYKEKHYISDLTLDEGSIIRRSPEIEHERNVAIADLLEDNQFYPCNEDGHAVFGGPYALFLSIRDNRLVFDVTSDVADDAQLDIVLPVAPFRSTIKDYFLICDSYYKATKSGNTSQVEAIDMGRRGIHNEGSELLAEMLAGKIQLNFETARRLFTLICVLHLR